MLEQNIESSNKSSVTAARRLRLDNISASIIEQALVVQSCHGTYLAARLLQSKGISLGIALRTLTQPGRHRTCAAPALMAPRLYGVSTLMYRHTCA
jgi:hypothetical protein